MRLPTPFASIQACEMNSQAYLAGTSLARDIGAQDRIKIVCAPTSGRD